MRLAALACAFVACACGTSFDHVNYEPIGGVPDGVLLRPRLVSLPVGVSVAAHIIAVNDSNQIMGCEPTLTSDVETIMMIERADRGSTVFTGVAPGGTTILVHCSGEDGTIAGRVTTTPSP